jgi:hypothetical protein
VTDWYRKNLDTKYEGGPMPWLYHHYAGHDNNRDYAFNLAETRAICRVLFHDWFPQIYDDKHQTWPYRIRCFVPPFVDPADPAIHPLVFSGLNLIGANMAYDLQKKGLKGVAQARNYASAWYKGALTSVGMIHNIVTVFSEMASIKMATPIYIDSTEIHGRDPDQWDDLSTKSLTYLDPWPGGWWRLRDIVDYELSTSFSLLEIAISRKEDWLYNSYKMGRDAIEAGKKGDPFAFIIPEEQVDYPTALRMLNILMFGGAEIHRARENFVADGKEYAAGSFVVLASQPYRPTVLAYLEQRKYPNIHVAPKLRDNAGHEIPLQMGVSFTRIAEPFKAKLDKLESIPSRSVTPPAPAPFIVLDSRVNASYPVAISLLREKAEVFRCKEFIEGEEFKAAAGSFIVRNTIQVQKSLAGLLEKWHLAAYGLEEIADIPKAPLRNPRVGLYQSWKDNKDEGWTRYVFDDFEIPFVTLRNEDFRATRGVKVDLKQKFDVIVFADENPDIIKTGTSSQTARRFEINYGALPPSYQGGIGDEGVEALKAFVEQGGIVVALNNASGLFIKEFKMPARNVLDGIPQSKFFCLKSLLRVKVDNTSPIGYGMPDEAAAMYGGEYASLAFNTWHPPTKDWERTIVANYPADNILLRGGLIGEDLIAQRAAVVDFKYKKGHIILVGLLCQHRAQTHATYKFLFNSLLYAETE